MFRIGRSSFAGENHIKGVDDPGDVSEQCEDDIEPKVEAQPDLQCDSHGRQEYGQNDAEKVFSSFRSGGAVHCLVLV